MSPTLSEKCQFHVIPSPSSLSPSSSTATATVGPTVHCEPTKAEEQEEMETEGQLSITINVHVGEYASLSHCILLVHAWMSVYFGVIVLYLFMHGCLCILV